MDAPKNTAELVLLGLVLANVVGLNFKIVWDWLRSGRTGNGTPLPVKGGIMCPVHEACRPQIDAMKGQVARHEVLIQEHHADIFRELEKGEKAFAAIEGALGELTSTYAAVKERVASIQREQDRMRNQLDNLKG